MNVEKSIEKSFSVSFVPHKLEISGKPEFDFFPLNVLFVSFVFKEGRRSIGSAMYEPDFDSFSEKGNKYSMKYNNVYGKNCWLLITYNKKEKTYHGDKFVNGCWSGGACGIEWNMFFMHFTVLGLIKDEKCKIEKLN